MTLEERVAALEKAVMGKAKDKIIELDLIFPAADIDGLRFDEIKKRAIFELKEDGLYHSRDILFLSARNTEDDNSVDILTKYLKSQNVKDAFIAALTEALIGFDDIELFLPKGNEGIKKYNGVDWWYWLAEAYSASAANFCNVNNNGNANNNNASSVGGCAPDSVRHTKCRSF
jgi:hypothetical protein